MLCLMYHFAHAQLPDSSCGALNNIKQAIPDIIAQPKHYSTNSNDSCVLTLIDSISELAIKTKGEKYLAALNAICRVSDGYVGEDLDEVCKDEFYRNFKAVIRFCATHQNAIRQHIIWGLSMEISMSKNRKLQENNLDQFIEKGIKSHELTATEAVYLHKLRKEVDPKIFD